jgi:hypothetical protein
MEINRTIKKETYDNILDQYRQENEDEINKFMKIISGVKDNLNIGEKMIQYRYKYFCGQYIDEIFKNLKILDSNAHKLFDINENEYRNSILENFESSIQNIRYGNNNLVFEEYKRCKFFTKPKIENILNKLKQRINNLKKEQSEIINKCFVLEFEETEIKNCLKSEFSLQKKNIMHEIGEYYDELTVFKDKIYI